MCVAGGEEDDVGGDGFLGGRAGGRHVRDDDVEDAGEFWFLEDEHLVGKAAVPDEFVVAGGGVGGLSYGVVLVCMQL